jgi:hypothetical protein
MDQPVGGVDGVAADAGSRGWVGARQPAGDGTDPGKEFVDTEGFGDVVVGAGIEGGDLSGAVAASGEDHDRDRGPGAQLADDLDAIEVGEAQIEHDQVGVVGRGGVQRLGAVGGGDDLVPAACRLI